ncbi:MAG: SOS response-associated peptidase [Ignavibacteria bacterium]|jgi:putative SOS response-associated peptidase YedK|nr:SOS response-associated peptidase [Ignavibacteria bacterium]MCU7504651.1 SOS response-associated peptidase [Ignavibacteria bacterium]MCU7517541.1 SOS response-associated peptidase [Ignavibacteria bacterium]
MCGRFENNIDTGDLFEALQAKGAPLKAELSRQNIAPTQKIMTLIGKGEGVELIPMNWGIKFTGDSHLIFNSRIETIKEKPYWQRLFSENKCLVPMTAFYEWKKEGTRKVPYRIYLPGEKFFFVPALYIEKDKQFYASLITTVSNKFIEKLHHRMPVILKINEALDYLKCDSEANLKRCIPLSSTEKMDMEQVAL